jgi:glycosyltransferase involved in cell wall biosynthesis
MAHGLETLLQAAQRLAATPGGDRIRLLLLGDGARKAALKTMAAEMGLRNVVFVDSVPKDEVARYWSLLDVSVIHLRRTELFTTVIPSKLFECMGMGLPVLHGVAGESADIVRREDVGVVFEPEDAEALARLLLDLAADPARLARWRANGLVAAHRYDRDALAARLHDILRATANAARA